MRQETLLRAASEVLENQRARHRACARMGQNRQRAMTNLSAGDAFSEAGAPCSEASDDFVCDADCEELCG